MREKKSWHRKMNRFQRDIDADRRQQYTPTDEDDDQLVCGEPVRRCPETGHARPTPDQLKKLGWIQ